MLTPAIAVEYDGDWILHRRPGFAGTRISLVFPGPRIGAHLSRVRSEPRQPDW